MLSPHRCQEKCSRSLTSPKAISTGSGSLQRKTGKLDLLSLFSFRKFISKMFPTGCNVKYKLLVATDREGTQ